LIQILRVNAAKPVDAELAAAKAGRVNRTTARAEWKKRHPAVRIPPSSFRKVGNCDRARFTGR
jgi:hypothetical protein